MAIILGKFNGDFFTERKYILNSLFDFEDEYLQNQPSDFVFGIYQLKKS